MKTYPKGKLNNHDEGSTTIRCFIDKDRVILDFGKQIKWLGFDIEDAITFGEGIIKKAKELEDIRKKPNDH